MNTSALFRVSYGMYVVSSIDAGRPNGQIANTVFQVTSDPAQIAVCVNRANLTHEFIMKSRLFSVSVLDLETPMTLIGRFGFKSGRDIEKFSEVKYGTASNGLPYLTEHCLAFFTCETALEPLNAGTHTLFVGKVVDAEVLAGGEPMTYAYYHLVKKGLSPKTAPTYVKTENKQEERT